MSDPKLIDCEKAISNLRGRKELGHISPDSPSKEDCRVCDGLESAIEYLLSASPVEPPVLSAVVNLVNEQAEDEGLWFEAQTMPEAYLQQELRRLHEVIENSAPPVLSRAAIDEMITKLARGKWQHIAGSKRGLHIIGAEDLRDAIWESLSQEDANE